MAEYYPLISRAVAGLRDGAPEARQAIYGRAKQALVGQLRGMQPPIPEAAIDKEIAALDDAIARIEGEIVPVPVPPVAAEAAPTIVTPLPNRCPETATNGASGSAHFGTAGGAGRHTPAGTRGFRTASQSSPSRPAVARPVRPSAPTVAPAEATAATQPVTPVPVPEPRSAPVLPIAATLKEADPVVEPALTGPAVPVPQLRVQDEDQAGAVTPMPELSVGEGRGREEVLRPAIPRAETPRPRNLRAWIVAFVALAAVVIIALTAWKLRDSPEVLARAANPPPQAEATPGKIVERADGVADDADASDTGAIVAGSGQAPASTASAASAPAGTTQPAGDQAIPVSYKAAILVAAPDTPEKVKTYVGSVVWRTENVAQGQGQPLGTAVRADVDIPEAKIQLVIEIRKNIEAQFPASHTMDFRFTVGAGSPVGGVKQIDVPQMRREDAPTGDPLIGVPVTITGNYFLVGLTRGDAEARNVEAMRTRGWLDVPLVLDDDKAAKITFEKGASGDRILSDALAAWSRP